MHVSQSKDPRVRRVQVCVNSGVFKNGSEILCFAPPAPCAPGKKYKAVRHRRKADRRGSGDARVSDVWRGAESVTAGATRSGESDLHSTVVSTAPCWRCLSRCLSRSLASRSCSGCAMTARPRHCCCCSPARRIHGATKQPESRRSTHSRRRHSTTAAAACGLLAPTAPTSRSPPSTCAALTCPPWSSSTLRARTCVLRRLWRWPVAGGLRPSSTLSMRRGRAPRRRLSARRRLRRCR